MLLLLLYKKTSPCGPVAEHVFACLDLCHEKVVGIQKFRSPELDYRLVIE
jgi:hypothetical protein